MTHSIKKAPFYPKSHLLAASGVAALLSLALLVFPSREVEAKRTSINLELESATGIGAAGQNDDLGVTTRSNGTGPHHAPTPPPSEAASTEPAQIAPSERVLTVTVSKGDTLSTLFEQTGLPATILHQILASGSEAKELVKLRIGQELQFTFAPDGQLDHLSTKLSKLATLNIVASEYGFTASKDVITPELKSVYTAGVIDSSLFVAAKDAGLGHSLTMDLANVFGYDIDFALDIRKGDSFELIYEQKLVDGKAIGHGDILAARFTNRGKTFTAVRFSNKQGFPSYYTAEGESMRKAFIRTPVDFARISSRFSSGRKHPILNKIRAHTGVDYAAPRGTPIKSAGDGKVVLAGRKGGYGNTVIIQHGSRYRTLYAHMQGFATGIRNGSPVKQGQIIGYIGTTGLSTGPHLHYEFQVDGKHVDPLSQKLPMADPINKSEIARFKQISQPLLARMDEEKASHLALIEQ